MKVIKKLLFAFGMMILSATIGNATTVYATENAIDYNDYTIDYHMVLYTTDNTRVYDYPHPESGLHHDTLYILPAGLPVEALRYIHIGNYFECIINGQVVYIDVWDLTNYTDGVPFTSYYTEYPTREQVQQFVGQYMNNKTIDQRKYYKLDYDPMLFVEYRLSEEEFIPTEDCPTYNAYLQKLEFTRMMNEQRYKNGSHGKNTRFYSMTIDTKDSDISYAASNTADIEFITMHMDEIVDKRFSSLQGRSSSLGSIKYIYFYLQPKS